MTRANNISEVVGSFAVKKKKREKKRVGKGAFISGQKIDNESGKDKTRNKEDESCARLPLDWDACIPANGTTHVGSKNVNRPEVSDADP